MTDLEKLIAIIAVPLCGFIIWLIKTHRDDIERVEKLHRDEREQWQKVQERLADTSNKIVDKNTDAQNNAVKAFTELSTIIKSIKK